jgi:hypothetical protein
VPFQGVCVQAPRDVMRWVDGVLDGSVEERGLATITITLGMVGRLAHLALVAAAAAARRWSVTRATSEPASRVVVHVAS